MLFRIEHPAYSAILGAERCWATDPDQAEARARILVHVLVAEGVITDGEWIGGQFLLAGKEIPSTSELCPGKWAD